MKEWVTRTPVRAVAAGAAAAMVGLGTWGVVSLVSPSPPAVVSVGATRASGPVRPCGPGGPPAADLLPPSAHQLPPDEQMLLIYKECLRLASLAPAGTSAASQSGQGPAPCGPALLPSSERRLPPAKQAPLIRAECARLNNAGHTGPPPVDSPPAQHLAGIVGLHWGGPFTKTEFQGTNLWNGPVDGRWMTVQAGGAPTPEGVKAIESAGLPAPGETTAAVYVYTTPLDPTAPGSPHVLGVFPAPGGPRGLLTVQGVQGDTLTLGLSGSSTLYHFDVATLAFK